MTFHLALFPMLLLSDTAATTLLHPQQIIERLHVAGYTEVRDLEFEHGLWGMDARRDFGLWGEVAVDPATGIIYDNRDERRLLSRATVRAALQRQGYVAISDLEREGAIWEADARDSIGRSVELRISGYDGRILNVELDHHD